jgi:hypothetical protein
MATKHETIRRNDVIHCEKCGEDYSVTYKRCPFCDERPSKGGVPAGRRVAGYGGRVNPLQIVGLVLSLVLIIAALYIVFTTISPLLGRGSSKTGSQSQSALSSSQSTSADGSGNSSADVSVGDLSTVDTPAVSVNSLTLSSYDFTLKANESARITATVDPADTQVTWTSSDESAALVGADGTVSNVNTGSSQVKVTITATAGDKSAECTVYCRGGSTGTGSAAGTSTTTPSTTTTTTTTTTSGGTVSVGASGVVSGASKGLNVRSGPGSSYDRIASLNNGVAVTVLEDTGTGWYKISFTGPGGRATEGYVSKDFISAG